MKFRYSAGFSEQDGAAFTLIELLVVIAIIAILASLMFPALARAKEKAKVTKVYVELYGVGNALEMYSEDNEGKLPPVRGKLQFRPCLTLVSISNGTGSSKISSTQRQGRNGGLHAGCI